MSPSRASPVGGGCRPDGLPLLPCDCSAASMHSLRRARAARGFEVGEHGMLRLRQPRLCRLATAQALRAPPPVSG